MKIKFKSNYYEIYNGDEALKEALSPFFDIEDDSFYKEFSSLEELKEFCIKIKRVYSSLNFKYMFKCPDFIYKPDLDIIEIYDFYIE